MATLIEKNSYNLMLNKYRKQLEGLYATQEAIKPKDATPQKTPLIEKKTHGGPHYPYPYRSENEQFDMNNDWMNGPPKAGKFNAPNFYPPANPMAQSKNPMDRINSGSYAPGFGPPANPLGPQDQSMNPNIGTTPTKGVGTARPGVPAPPTSAAATTTPGYSMINQYDNSAFEGQATPSISPSTQDVYRPEDFAFGVDPAKARQDAVLAAGQVSNQKSFDELGGASDAPDDGAGKFDWANAGLGALGMAPIAYNLFQGMKKEQKLNPKDFYNPYENDVRSAMRNRRFNVRPLLERNKANQQTYNSNIRKIVGGNAGSLMSNYGAGYAGRMAADSAVGTQADNMNQQYLAEQAQMDAQLGANRAGTRLSVQNMNDQNEAARRNYLAASAGQLSQFGQTQQFMRNQKATDKMRAQTVDASSQFAEKWFPFLEQILNRR